MEQTQQYNCSFRPPKLALNWYKSALSGTMRHHRGRKCITAVLHLKHHSNSNETSQGSNKTRQQYKDEHYKQEMKGTQWYNCTYRPSNAVSLRYNAPLSGNMWHHYGSKYSAKVSHLEHHSNLNKTSQQYKDKKHYRQETKGHSGTGLASRDLNAATQ